MAYLLDQDWSYEERPGQSPLDNVPSTFSDYVGAAYESNTVLNPVKQIRSLYELRQLGPRQKGYYTDELGNQQEVTTLGLEPDDPRARRLSLDEANEAGKEMGLRFSEPPTQGQFDYLADLKRKENSRARILSNSPGIVATSAGFLAGLAATATDPLNIAVGFVPVVGEARYAAWAARFGRGGAVLAKGAAEGFAGTAPIVPLTAFAASQLQQQYGVDEAFMDLVMGTALGAGLHWGGHMVRRLYRGEFHVDAAEFMRKHDPSEKWAEAIRSDRRKGTRVQEGDNAARHEAMPREDRAGVLNAAVKAVESDQVPKIDTLFAASSRVGDLAMPDKRYKSTVKLRSDLTAADYVTGTRAGSIIDMAMGRRLTNAKLPATPTGVFTYFAKRFKSLAAYSLKEVPPAEFGQRVGNALEHPDQRVAVEESTKTILATDGASLGAVRHEVERALDAVQKVASDGAGGYRYKAGEVDLLNAHHAAMEELAEERGQVPAMSGRGAVDEFSRRDEPIMGWEGVRIADHAEETVNRDKDRDLESMIKDEEIAALETIVDVNQGLIKDLGIMDKTIPPEERILLDEAAARKGMGSQVNDLFKAADHVVDKGLVGKSVSEAELLLRASLEQKAAIVTGVKSTKAVIKEVEDAGLVTRVNAVKDVNFYVKRNGPKLQKLRQVGEATSEAAPKKFELSDQELERAIRDVQNGEDVDVAVDRAVRGGDLISKADAAAREPEPGVAELKAPGEEAADDDFDEIFGDVIEDAKAIIEAEKIDDKRDLAIGEAQIVREEHAALEELPKVRDLFSSVERDEFNEADRDRALRQGDGAGQGVARGGAGDRNPRGADATGVQTAFIGRDGETIGGAQPHTERARTAPGGERPAPETTQSYGGWAVPRRVITPDGSVQVGIEPRIVELADLVHAEGDLQVRDRGRKESKIEALNRARQLDPEQLLPNRVADTGAPIVLQGPVNPETGRYTYTIISGNGRVLSLREVYADETLGFKARAYREMVGPAADGYRSPILVSVIADQLSHEELVDFAQLANRSRIAEMSVTEKAQRDADVAGPDLMGLYQGGEFTKKENQPFFRAFMNKVVTAQERGEMSKNGVLTKPGLDRLNAAVLAAAYDDTGVLSLMLESTDNNIKSIAGAYRDVAPAFMKLRADIAQGLVREEMDITSYMMEAARYVQEARDKGVKIANALAQVDALNPMDPLVDRLIRQFYNPQLTRANSSLRIGEVLRLYAEAAREKRTGGFLEDTTTAADVVSAAERRFSREASEEILAIDDEDAGGGNGGERQAAPQPTPNEPRPVTDLGSQGGSAQAPARTAIGTGSKVRDDIYSSIVKLNPNLESRRIYIKDIIDSLPNYSKEKIHSELMKMSREEKIVIYSDDNPRTRTKDRIDAGITIPGLTEKSDTRTIVYIQPGFKSDISSYKTNQSKIDLRAQAVIDKVGGEKAAAEIMGVPAAAEAKIQAFLNDMAKTGALDKITEPAPKSELQLELEKMKLPAIRERAKAEGLDIKGRSKEQVIASYLKAAKAKQPEPVVTPQPIKSTLSDFVRVSSAASIYEHMTILRDDVTSLLGRNAFDGKAKVIVERLAKKAEDVEAMVKAHDWQGVGETVSDMADDAARLSEIDKRTESNVVTQWVRSAAREVNIADKEAKAIEAVPVREEKSQVFDTPEGAVRSAFYDFLEGGKPIKGSGQLAKDLGIDPNQAYLLLDEAENLGWIKLKSNGVYIRVPREQRPLRPDVKFEDGEAMGDVVPFSGRRATIDDRYARLTDKIDSLRERSSAIRDEWERLRDAGDEAGAETAYSQRLDLEDQIDELRVETNDLLEKRYTRTSRVFDEIEKTDLPKISKRISDLSVEIRSMVVDIEETLDNSSDPNAFATRRKLQVLNERREAAEIEREKLIAEHDRRHQEIFDRVTRDGEFATEAPDDLTSSLENFITSGRRNIWIYGDGFSLYVRQMDFNGVKRFDISSIDVERTGQGTFKNQILPEIERLTRERGFAEIYVENVLTDRFADFFRRTPGWVEEPSFSRGTPPSFRKVIDRQADAGKAPPGWGAVDGDNPIANQLSSKTDLYGMLRQQLAEAEKDMVRAAQRPDKLSKETLSLIRIVGDRIDGIKKEIRSVLDEMRLLATALEKEKFERDLQSSLVLQRAVADAAKRIKDLPIQIQILDKMEIAGFGPARGGMFPYTMPNGARGALIQVLRGVGDAVNIVNHEIFHAMRALGLFSKLEWRIVREAAAEAGGLRKESLARYEPYMRIRAERLDLHPSLDKHFVEDKLAEEWAATDFGRWSEKRGSERETAIGRLWGRIKDFMEDLRQSFANIGRRARGLQEKPSLEQIYRAIEDGSFARRYQEWGLDRTGIDNPLSVNRQAGDEFAVMLNRDMRAIAHDDSESVAKATEIALQHLAPCAAYHL